MIDDLVIKAKQNDLQALEEIIKLYEKRVYNLALRYLRNHDDALDAAQDVFIQIYHSIGSFRGESAFSTWVYRITYNNCVDSLRKRAKKQRDCTFDEQVLLKMQNGNTSPQQQYENKEMVESVLNAVESLPQGFKDVIILRSVKELSYREIGEVLDIAEGTVKSRLNRARLKIKDLMAQRGTII